MKKAEPQPSPPGRRQKRAEQTRVKLVRCALRLIARRGLANVTVEDITEAADVGKGTFFNYFESKEQVLGVLAEMQLARIRSAEELAGKGGRPIQAILKKLMRDLAVEPGRNPRIAQAMLSSSLADKRVRGAFRGHMLQERKLIGGIVAAGQQRGEIDRKLRRDAVAAQLLQVYLGAVLAWAVEERPALSTLLSNSFNHCWRAISAPRKVKRR